MIESPELVSINRRDRGVAGGKDPQKKLSPIRAFRFPSGDGIAEPDVFQAKGALG